VLLQFKLKTITEYWLLTTCGSSRKQGQPARVCHMILTAGPFANCRWDRAPVLHSIWFFAALSPAAPPSSPKVKTTVCHGHLDFCGFAKCRRGGDVRFAILHQCSQLSQGLKDSIWLFAMTLLSVYCWSLWSLVTLNLSLLDICQVLALHCHSLTFIGGQILFIF
jgi:hypothetical protein